jgi:predicted negative regulator of RcsB-dependent stress response
MGIIKRNEMYKYFLTSLIMIFAFSLAQSQGQSTAKQNYLQGKEMYETGRFDFAMEVLKPLTLPTNKSIYTPYAAYYYSLSAIEKGYTYLAEEMLKSTIVQNKDWENIDMTRFWLTKVYFDEAEYISGLAVIDDITNPLIKQQCDELIKTLLAELNDVELITDLYNQYPNIEGVAIVLADKIILQPLMDQERDLLFSIVETFNLDKDKYNFIDVYESEKKDSYNVAILLPFMLTDIVPNNLKRSNQFVLDIYEGIKIGVNRLEHRLIKSGELDGMDLLIGPLYPETVKLVSDFSLRKRINMFNPLSSNSDLIANNPFCFLFKPTNENIAYAASNFINSYKENRNAIIFYEDDPRDSIIAYTYKAAIEEDSFNVVLTQKITGLDTISVYNTLTQKVRFDNLKLTGEDSVRIIERYNLYDYFEKLQRVRSYEELKKIRPLELLVIAPDSIGHIFVATNKELIAASTISGMETRGDLITIVGYEDWLNFRSMSLSQMESLDIKFIAPGYISNSNPLLQDVYQKILYSTNKSPTKYHYLGYELINFVGEMLHLYGTYFQVGLREQGVFHGILYEGYDYTRSNDNQFIPIIGFQDSHFSIDNQ